MAYYRMYNHSMFLKLQNHLYTNVVSKGYSLNHGWDFSIIQKYDINVSIFSIWITFQTRGKSNISPCTNKDEKLPCSELTTESLTYEDSGLYSCVNVADINGAELNNGALLEWHSCNDQNDNREMATITSPTIYVFVKGKLTCPLPYCTCICEKLYFSSHIFILMYA